MITEARMAPQCAKYTNAINKILRSRGLEQEKVIGSIRRTGTNKWIVTRLVKDGAPFPDQIFSVVEGRMTWRAAT